VDDDDDDYEPDVYDDYDEPDDHTPEDDAERTVVLRHEPSA
jgi:hypothetical protein